MSYPIFDILSTDGAWAQQVLDQLMYANNLMLKFTNELIERLTKPLIVEGSVRVEPGEDRLRVSGSVEVEPGLLPLDVVVLV